MKQSWVVGIMVLYIALQGWTMVIQTSTTGASNIWTSLNSMWYTNLTQMVGTTVTAIWAPALTVISAFMAFGGAVLLYYPAIFNGSFLWFWWCICLPVAIGFIISIITIIRGVHAG